MIKLSVGEYQFQTTTDEIRSQITAMAREFGHDWSMDFEFETRWISMTEEQYMLAAIKYNSIVKLMRQSRI